MALRRVDSNFKYSFRLFIHLIFFVLYFFFFCPRRRGYCCHLLSYSVFVLFFCECIVKRIGCSAQQCLSGWHELTVNMSQYNMWIDIFFLFTVFFYHSWKIISHHRRPSQWCTSNEFVSIVVRISHIVLFDIDATVFFLAFKRVKTL